MTIAAVILAAGMATRMGSVKQLLPWGKSTILGSTIDLYAKANVDKIIVVVGYYAPEIMKALHNKPVKWVINKEFQSGMASSLQAGIKALDKEDEVCLLGLGDTPLLRYKTINQIIEAHQFHQAQIVVPYYGEQSGHPILVTSQLFSELLKVRGDVGARFVIKAHNKSVFRLEVDDEGVIIDLDTQESYQTYYNKFGGRL